MVLKASFKKMEKVKTIYLKNNEVLEVKSKKAGIVIENKKEHLIIMEKNNEEKNALKKETTN